MSINTSHLMVATVVGTTLGAMSGKIGWTILIGSATTILIAGLRKVIAIGRKGNAEIPNEVPHTGEPISRSPQENPGCSAQWNGAGELNEFYKRTPGNIWDEPTEVYRNT